MKLKQLKGLVKVKDGGLISNCHNHGQLIGILDDELFEEYGHCNIAKICSEAFGLEIWIDTTPRLQNRLCKKCECDDCWKYTMHKDYTPKLTSKTENKYM